MGGCMSYHRLRRNRKSFHQIQTVHKLTTTKRSKCQHFVNFLTNNNNNNNNDSYSKKREPGELLSPYQKHILRVSWAIDIEPHIDQFGAEIYRRVFDADPTLKMLFVYSDIPTERLIKLQSFHLQTRKIMSVIEMCVNTLDNLEGNIEFLETLGAKHTKFRGFGFTPIHWQLFRQSMLLSLTSNSFTSIEQKECQEAWNILIGFIVDKMKEGYDCHVIKVQSSISDSYNSQLILRKDFLIETQNSQPPPKIQCKKKQKNKDKVRKSLTT